MGCVSRPRCVFILFLMATTLSCSAPASAGAAETASRDTSQNETALAAPSHPVLLPFRSGSLLQDPWGYRTAEGSIIIPPQFAFASDFHDGVARVQVFEESEEREPEPSLWGFLTPSGQWAIPPRYKAATDFKDGEALALLEGEFVFIGGSGEIRQRFWNESDAQELPLPADSCSSLAQYIDSLGALTPFYYSLIADPREGERWHAFEVRRLRFSALEVRELGWEGWSLVLVLPHMKIKDAQAIVQRIIRHHEHKDITEERVFDDEATYEFLKTEAMNEFLRIRLRPKGGVEIRHTQWAG